MPASNGVTGAVRTAFNLLTAAGINALNRVPVGGAAGIFAAAALVWFAPELRPWTRCTACNGLLKAATKEEVADRLEGGTQRSYDVFAQCGACGRAYWKGAHHEQLEAIVRDALRMRTG